MKNKDQKTTSGFYHILLYKNWLVYCDLCLFLRVKNNIWIINDCRDENCSKKSKTNPSQIWSSQKITFLSYVVFFLKTKSRHINFLKLSNYRKIKRHKSLRSHSQSTRVMVLSQLSRLFVLIIFFESWFINQPLLCLDNT